MNEVGLSADSATELGRLLDSNSSLWQHTPESFLASSRSPAAGSPLANGQRGPANIAAAAPSWPAAAAAPQHSLWKGGGGLRLGGFPPGDPFFQAQPQQVLSGRAL